MEEGTKVLLNGQVLGTIISKAERRGATIYRILCVDSKPPHKPIGTMSVTSGITPYDWLAKKEN